MSLEDAVKIDNPLIDEMTHLRTSLLPGLLEAAEYNSNRQEHDIAVFELGKVFKSTASKPEEKNCAAALLTGSVFKGMIENDKLNQDLYFMKGLLENIFDSYSTVDITFEVSADPHSEPGMSTDIFAAGIKIGFLSKVSKKIQEAFGLSKPVFVFEIDTDVISKKEKTGRIFREAPRFPSVRRDIAMFLPEGVLHGTIIETIKQAGGSLVEDTDVFDKFESKGKKSLAYYVIYRDQAKTLKDEDVNSVHKKVVESLETKLGVEIRK
jgi:phenylalanyl-tRNA synthetase beta chain